MEIYNTLTNKKELFEPHQGKKIRMFVCGPTVYDYIHIGNARTFVVFDVVAKYLRYQGYDIEYIQNITDIDNKIIERAAKEGIDPLKYAEKYTEIFKQDMQALGITSPEYKNATDHIPEVIKQVQALLDKGNAYVIENDGIYFDLSTFPDYGKLSGRTALMANDAVSRIDDSDKKRNRGDFAIWKFSQSGDPSWSAPFGDGRPGWHIEDTAITDKYFGPQYDIHGGGQDLIFPHHEAEIAQQESVSGLKPFVKYWMHAGFLVNKNEKMSKSVGNFSTAREMLSNYSKETLRFYFLSAHYHSPLQFSEEILKQAQAATQRISQVRSNLLSVDNETGEEIELDAAKKNFYDAMDNDFNVPEAIGNIFTLIKQVNPLIVSGSLTKKSAKEIGSFLLEINDVFGIIPEKHESAPQSVWELSDKRDKLRESGNYTEADKTRTQIEGLGYRVEDTVYGPLVVKK